MLVIDDESFLCRRRLSEAVMTPYVGDESLDATTDAVVVDDDGELSNDATNHKSPVRLSIVVSRTPASASTATPPSLPKSSSQQQHNSSPVTTNDGEIVIVTSAVDDEHATNRILFPSDATSFTGNNNDIDIQQQVNYNSIAVENHASSDMNVSAAVKSSVKFADNINGVETASNNPTAEITENITDIETLLNNPPTLLRFWAQKKGHVNVAPRPRYFVFCRGVLTYFTDEHGQPQSPPYGKTYRG